MYFDEFDKGSLGDSIALETQATTELEGETGKPHAVHLSPGEPGSHGAILRIDGTGGHWCVSTLLEIVIASAFYSTNTATGRERIWIDYGQRFVWTNVREVLAEAMPHCRTTCNLQNESESAL